MSGSINFRSEYGKGTTFTFDIKDFEKREQPLQEFNNSGDFCYTIQEDGISAFPESFINQEQKAEPLKRILIVDDELICSHVLAGYCKSLKVSCEIVILLKSLL